MRLHERYSARDLPSYNGGPSLSPRVGSRPSFLSGRSFGPGRAAAVGVTGKGADLLQPPLPLFSLRRTAPFAIRALESHYGEGSLFISMRGASLLDRWHLRQHVFVIS